jgi:hypothetical protein
MMQNNVPTADNKQTTNTMDANTIIRFWGHDVDWWNGAMLVALSFAAIAAVAVVAATTGVIVSQKQQSAADQEALEKYKADSGVRTATLEKETEALKGANLKLEAQVAPRRLTSQQQQSIGSALARFAGRRMRIKSYALDIDAAILGQQIIASLQAINIGGDDRRMSEGALGAIAIGIHVAGDDKELIDATLAAFSSVGLAVSPEPVPIMAGTALSDDGTTVAATIFVGVKPIAQ